MAKVKMVEVEATFPPPYLLMPKKTSFKSSSTYLIEYSSITMTSKALKEVDVQKNCNAPSIPQKIAT